MALLLKMSRQLEKIELSKTGLKLKLFGINCLCRVELRFCRPEILKYR
jgi:hypothetical protein